MFHQQTGNYGDYCPPFCGVADMSFLTTIWRHLNARVCANKIQLLKQLLKILFGCPMHVTVYTYVATCATLQGMDCL